MSLLQRLVNVLAPAGIAVAAGAVIWARTGRTLWRKVFAGKAANIQSHKHGPNNLAPAIAGGEDVKRKVWLTFTRELVDRPLVWEIGQKLGILDMEAAGRVSGSG